MKIVVDEQIVEYSVTGDGPTVLLLHGWGDTGKGLSDHLGSLISSFRVIVIDLPGFGLSQAPAKPWNLDDYANFLKKFLAKTETKPVFAIVGHSNGGALAVRALSMGAVDSQRLILLAAAGMRSGNRIRRAALKVIAKVGKASTFWLPSEQRLKLQKKMYGAVGSDMFVAEHLKETFKLTVRQDVQKDAAMLAIPTLLVFGEDDNAVPLKDGYTYKRLINNAELLVLKDSGHFVHIDQEAQVNDAIMKFLLRS